MYQQRISGREINRIYNPVIPEEGVASKLSDPLTLDIPDKDLVDIIDKKIEDSREFYRKNYSLYDRRSKNEIYFFGRQLTQAERDGELKEYESRNQDNVLYEIEANLKPLAMSQLPDMIVLPGDNTPEKREVAKEVSQAIDSDIKSRMNRTVLGKAFKHLPVYFTGVIKVRWDPARNNGLGDYVFEVIHPDNIDFDHNCTTNNADDMEWIAQSVPITVHEMLIRFPKAGEKLMEQLQDDGIVVGEKPNWKGLDTQVRMSEVWFTWNEESEKGKYIPVEGVVWKYKKVILAKMKNPNFDYKGKKQLFSYQVPGDKSTARQITLAEMQWALTTGQFPINVEAEQMYFNYHESPKKPFFFMGYDQWGKQPLDETSRIEQNIHNQEELDKRGKQISETLDQRGHFIWGKESGFSAGDIERMDHNNPEQDYLVEGSPKEAYAYVEPPRPEKQEFDDQDRKRDRMYAISGSNAIRGQIQSPVATTNQIAREANYTRADDLVEDTINAAAEWMASYALQFIKLRYTVDHWRKILGARGDVIFVKLNRDMIDEGMEVRIKASGTDKIKKQNNAMESARINMIDPLNYNRDMGYEDFAQRTRDLLLYIQASKGGDFTNYLTSVVGEYLEPDQVLNEAMQTNQQPTPGYDIMPDQLDGQPQQPPMGMPGMGQPPMGGAPQQPSPQNPAQVPAQPPTAPPPGSPRILG